MIVYQDRYVGDRRGPPKWLAGCRNLQCAEDHAGRIWGAGDSYLLGYQPGAIWESVGDHWSALVADEIRPAELLREQRWFDVRMVEDLEGRVWSAPVVLLAGNVRAFRTKYGGPSMLPILSPQQVHAEVIAKEARIALETAAAATRTAAAAGVPLGDEDGLPMAPACRWAAELLALTHHLSPAVIAALGILDDQLVADVLMASCGYRV